MAKLTKIKSVLKKMQSFKLTRTNSSSIAAAANNSSSSDDEEEEEYSARDLHPVYVGKSRRRYLVSSQVMENPVFRELVSSENDGDSVIVGCEVVLFEHMLWMMENADLQPESLDEIVEFYAC